MPSHRDSKGRFLADEATRHLRHDTFSHDTAESAWLAGLIAADGHITADGKRLGLAQSGTAGRSLIAEVRRITAHTGAVSVYHPPKGNLSYSVTMQSAQMIKDLADKFGVTPRKTLTYSWPQMAPHLTSAFLRGYVDGDGCVSTYPTPQGNPMLHLSFVGTPEFIDGAASAIPAHGRRRVIQRCKNLEEVRYNGRNAWTAATWLYEDEALFSSAKHQAFRRYQELLQADPPKWHTWSAQRHRILTLLSAGRTVAQVAAETGLPVGRVYGVRTKWFAVQPSNRDASSG